MSFAPSMTGNGEHTNYGDFPGGWWVYDIVIPTLPTKSKTPQPFPSDCQVTGQVVLLWIPAMMADSTPPLKLELANAVVFAS